LPRARNNLPVDRLCDPKAACEWLEARLPAGSNGFTGYDVPGWEARVWILHSMYENARLPADITHDDVHRAGLASGGIEPVIIGDFNLEEMGATVSGSALGRSACRAKGGRD